jgi:hypothetical protein
MEDETQPTSPQKSMQSPPVLGAAASTAELKKDDEARLEELA